MKFKIISPVFNAENFIEKHIESVDKQTYKEFEHIIINDGSTDSTKKYLKENDRRKVINFPKNKRDPLGNIVLGINTLCKDPDDVIILLDGDDWFASDDVLKFLNETYENQKNLLLTYGQFQPSSGSYKDFCKPLKNCSTYRREEPWVTSHLRTFKFKLFNKILDSDLRAPDNTYYKSGWDVALMCPMLEMCGNYRYKFIDKTLVIYNDQNPINDMKVRSGEQVSYAEQIRRKKRYSLAVDI